MPAYARRDIVDKTASEFITASLAAFDARSSAAPTRTPAVIMATARLGLFDRFASSQGCLGSRSALMPS